MARGPAYPYVDLKRALDLAQKLYKFAKRSSVATAAVVKEAWAISPKSSNAKKAVAALKYYGLAEETTGATAQIRLSDRGYRILADEESSPQRQKAIKDAALAPKQFRHCWEQWGANLPEDGAIRAHLLFERGFVEGTVDSFISDYRKTLDFAKLDNVEEGQIGDTDAEEQAAPNSLGHRLDVGCLVQWESAGAYQFKEPKTLRGFTADGTYAFVEGSDTGIPTTELKLVSDASFKPSESAVDRASGPTGKAPEPHAALRAATFPLPEGMVTLQWPDSLSAKSYQRLESWLELMKMSAQDSVSNGDVQTSE